MNEGIKSMANYGAHVTMCKEHGRSAWCFEDHDGQHLDYEECACLFFRPSPNCGLAIHRARAAMDNNYINDVARV